MVYIVYLLLTIVAAASLTVGGVTFWATGSGWLGLAALLTVAAIGLWWMRAG